MLAFLQQKLGKRVADCSASFIGRNSALVTSKADYTARGTRPTKLALCWQHGLLYSPPGRPGTGVPVLAGALGTPIFSSRLR